MLIHLYSHAGLSTATYKYYNPNTCMFDAEGAYSSLQVCTNKIIKLQYQILCMGKFWSKKILSNHYTHSYSK